MSAFDPKRTWVASSSLVVLTVTISSFRTSGQGDAPPRVHIACRRPVLDQVCVDPDLPRKITKPQAAKVTTMFNPTQIVIEAFIRELKLTYERTYGLLEPSYPDIIGFVARLSLENIASSDAAYHDVNHTIMVTLVGQEILRGRHVCVGGVTPHDW